MGPQSKGNTSNPQEIGECISSQVQLKVHHSVSYNICQLPKGLFSAHPGLFVFRVCVCVCVTTSCMQNDIKAISLIFSVPYNKENSLL